jgi:predicted nucleic acid-binding protein
MILVDGTAWIEYLRATGSPADTRLRELIEADEQLAVTDFVVMKVLAGARDDEHAGELRRMLARCEYLPVHAPGDFEQAAELYRRCRTEGAKVRRLPECVIAVVAMRHGASLLHADTASSPRTRPARPSARSHRSRRGRAARRSSRRAWRARSPRPARP